MDLTLITYHVRCAMKPNPTKPNQVFLSNALNLYTILRFQVIILIKKIILLYIVMFSSIPIEYKQFVKKLWFQNDINTRLAKARTAIDRLSVIWKSNLTDKIKRCFFPAAVESILLYRCTKWTLTKRIEKNLDGNYKRMLRAILHMSWRQHPTKQHLYGHLPTITKTIQVRRTRYAGHCWRCKDELISDVLQWTPSHGRAMVGRPPRTDVQQLCGDTGCSLEDLPGAMDDRDGLRERVREIRASGLTE